MRARVGHRTGLAVPLLLVATFLVAAPARSEQGTHESPRSAMLGYLRACRDADFERAAEFLDLSGAPDADGPTLARHLKTVLDQKLWIDLDELSNQPHGDLEDGLPRADRVGTIETETGDFEVHLERDAAGDWRLADATVARIEVLYDVYGLGRLGEFLPPAMFEDLGYLKLWQWAALPILVVLAYLIAALLTAIGFRIGLRLAGRTSGDLDDELLRAAAGPVTAALLLGLFTLGTLPLGLAGPVQDFLGGAAQALAVLAVTWLALRMADVASHALELRLAERGDTTAMTVIPVGRRISKVFLLTIAALAVLQNLGFNVLSIVAGLGVVGIAVAFAAQKTFENFFGALAIMVDQPVKVGDFCRYGDKVGTIEDIGLRSTRIRTSDRTVVTVPNGELSSLQIENFGPRDRIRFNTILGLRYETSADQLRHLLIALKRLLVEHPRVAEDPARVRFVGFGAYSLDVEINAYVDTSDWAEFLAIREDLLLRMIDLLEASGTGFAFPSQTLYVATEGGLDSERTAAAEQQVREWREQRSLCLPDYPADRLRELENTLPYPPDGSASG